jgi:hypothetical protein
LAEAISSSRWARLSKAAIAWAIFGAVMVEEGLSSDAKIVHRLAAAIDTERADLLAIGERHEQIGQLGVAMLRHELIHVVGAAPTVGLALLRISPTGEKLRKSPKILRRLTLES